MNYVIIPAAGDGLRLGGKTKKQFLPLKGRSLLDHVLNRFIESDLFSKIVVCLPKDELEKYRESGGRKASIIWVEGGLSRGESVRNGFKALSPKNDDVVLIHDAARPLVSLDLIRRVITATQKFGAVIPAIPVSDTVKEVMGGKVERTIDRKNLMSVQTPQGFLAQILEKAYEHVRAVASCAKVALATAAEREPPLRPYTDEAMLIEKSGQPVFVVEGERTNFKITTEFDLKLAENFL